MFALIGKKLGHSFSPVIHNLFFELHGISSKYDLIEIDEEQLNNKFHDIKENGYKGINVTIPYKTAVMPYLDSISEEASKINAVNTIVFDGESRGYNTDYYGFGLSLERLNIKLENKRVVILGSGGASKAAVAYCINNGSNITMISRDIDNAKESYEDFCNNYGSFDIIDYNMLSQSKESIDILINTTPVGMFPEINKAPVSSDIIKRCGFVYDMIFNPLKTKLLQQAEELSIDTENGLYMLVAQALKAEEIWNKTKISQEEYDTIYEKVLIKVSEK